MMPKIIFEDSEILVLDKPAGLIVNKSETTVGEKTVQEWVEEYLRTPRVTQDKSITGIKGTTGENSTRDTCDTRIPRDTFLARAGIVHRLDKETSGILLVAKTKESFANLQTQFKERKVKKTYIALVHGKIIPDKGEINVPVGRLPWNRKRFGILAEGKEAMTKYQIPALPAGRSNIKYLPCRQAGQISKTGKEPLTLLELYPKTGRTHQIRVHLKYLNHPIFADPLYAGRKTARNDRKFLSRVFLHASKISFYHPETRKEISFQSELPDELTTFLKTLSQE